MKSVMRTLFFVLLFSAGKMSAQDPEFTQMFSNPLSMNPAFAGSSGCSRIAFDFRSQWPELSGGGYKTSSISYDLYSEKLKGGIGVMYLYDNAHNMLFSNNLDFYYSYNLRCSKSFNIRPAVNIGVFRRSIDGSLFVPPVSPASSSNFNFNAGAGCLLIYENVTGGFALDHLNQPDVGFFSGVSRLPIKLIAHLNWEYKLSEEFGLVPLIVFQKQQNFEQIFPFLLFHYSYVKFGAGMRTNFDNADSFIMLIGFQNKKWSIGYSYDYTVSKLSNSTGGSHEITAVFKFRCKEAGAGQIIPLINNF